MPLFAVLFEDDPAVAAEVRQRHMAAHLAFLERNAAAVCAAGPLAEVDGSPGGGLWLVEAADRAAVEALVRADPFWPTGLRRAVRVLEWRQVFAEGRRRI
ncbi:MAG TPA: YciI family protein [Stellaceae bacterium]|nr:YciI family protein [Stellaceae bacterium]